MIPMLFESDTKKIYTELRGNANVPTQYRTDKILYEPCIGALADATKCTVTEELNGQYELQLQYPSNGKLADQITIRRIIAATPNCVDRPQPFRIYKISDTMDGLITVYARHITNDLTGVIIRPFTYTASGIDVNTAFAQILTHRQSAVSPFILANSDCETTVGKIGYSDPHTLRECMGGTEGSMIDTFRGEWQYDGWTMYFMSRRGMDRGLEIRYGKNLTSLTKETTGEEQYTHVLGYYQYTDTNTDQEVILWGLPVETYPDGEFNYTKYLLLDTSEHFGFDSDHLPTTQDITAYCEQYATDNNLAANKTTYSIGTLMIKDVRGERVELGDTVYLIYKGHKIQTRVNETVWDALAETYTGIRIGDLKESVVDAIKRIKTGRTYKKVR